MLVDQRQISAALYALETTTTAHGHRGLESYKLYGPSSHFGSSREAPHAPLVDVLARPPTTNDESPGIALRLDVRVRPVADATALLVAVA